MYFLESECFVAMQYISDLFWHCSSVAVLSTGANSLITFRFTWLSAERSEVELWPGYDLLLYV